MLQGMKARRGGAVEGLFCLQTDCRFLVGRRMLYHNYPLLNLLNGIPMLKRRYLALLPLCVLLAACSSKPKTPAETEMASGTGGFLLEPQHNVMQMGGDFANNPAAAQFIDKMVAKHGFDRQQLQEILSQAKRLDYVLRLMDRQAPTERRGVLESVSGRAQPRLSGLRRAAGNHRRHYRRGDSLGPGDGQNPDPRRAGDAVV